MTLLEFINDVLTKNNIEADAKKIEENITAIAEQRAVDGRYAISDGEVEQMVINHTSLETTLANEKAIKEAKEEEERKAEEEKKEKEKEEKKAQKEKEKAEKKAQAKAEKLAQKQKAKEEKEGVITDVNGKPCLF